MDDAPNGSQPAAASAASQLEKTENEAPFYDVMPKADAGGQIIGPKIQVEQSDKELPQASAVGDFFKLHKIVVIIILAVLLLFYPAYYALNKFILKSNEAESLLNEETLKNLENGKKPELKFSTPADWQLRFFGTEACEDIQKCGDDSDPDRDGMKNLEEFGKNTDPNNPDSDQDGLADGDELYVFSSDASKKSSADDPVYDDGQYLKGGYNPTVKDLLFTSEEIFSIKDRMKNFGLHEPTLTTLGDSLLEIYQFSPEKAGSQSGTEPDQSSSTSDSSLKVATSTEEVILKTFDQSAEAKQDRDTQRSTTIKTISIALDKYFEDKGSYPQSQKFDEMYSLVKPYIKVATKPVDPVNKDKYIYTYASASDGKDFTLTFYSETQGQIIKINAKTAAKYRSEEEAAINDDQRKTHLETIRTALLLYSANNAGGNQEYVFPSAETLQTSLVPQFIGEVPKDPQTEEPYDYQVSESFDSFTLKAYLGNPPTGRSGYMCNQEECRYY